MKKRLLIVALLFLFVICAFGCSNKSITNADDNLIANETMNEIVSAIRSKDPEKLHVLFSDSTKEDVDSLLGQVNKLLVFIQGDIVSSTDAAEAGVAADCKKDDGKVQKNIQSAFAIVTTEAKYYIAVKECTIDEFESRNVGLTSVYIIDSTKWTENYIYRGDGKWNKGINIDDLKSSDPEKQTEPSEASAYSIQTVVDEKTYPASSVAYPQLHSSTLDFTAVNMLIKQTLMSKVDTIFADSAENSTVTLSYTVCLQDEEYFCVLFEGLFSNNDVAYPTNLGFPICISLLENRIIDPTAIFSLDENFVAAFRKALLNKQNTERFDDEQWQIVASYIGSFTDEEILDKISADPFNTLALQTDGVIVLFPVIHALGDYVKVLVTL